VARAGKGKRWQYQLGVGRVRVPGKRRAKGPGFGAIRRRMSRGSRSSNSGGFSSGKAFLAIMTGGISLFFTGSPFSGAATWPRGSRSSGSKTRSTRFNPLLQVALPSRLAAQQLGAQQKLAEVEAELEILRQEVWAAENANEAATVRRGKKRIVQLHMIRKRWTEQLTMLQVEADG